MKRELVPFAYIFAIFAWALAYTALRQFIMRRRLSVATRQVLPVSVVVYYSRRQLLFPVILSLVAILHSVACYVLGSQTPVLATGLVIYGCIAFLMLVAGARYFFRRYWRHARGSTTALPCLSLDARGVVLLGLCELPWAAITRIESVSLDYGKDLRHYLILVVDESYQMVLSQCIDRVVVRGRSRVAQEMNLAPLSYIALWTDLLEIECEVIQCYIKRYRE